MEGYIWIILGVLAGAFSLFAVPHGFAIRGSASVEPVLRSGNGGSVNIKDAAFIGTAVGGRGASPGQKGVGGEGGSVNISGKDVIVLYAGGGDAGSVDSDTIWRPPGKTGYENAMEAAGQPIDPQMRKFGRGGMSPGYLGRFNIVEKIRGDYFKHTNTTPVDAVTNVHAVPIEYVNEKLAEIKVNWRARIVRDLDYEFYIPDNPNPAR